MPFILYECKGKAHGGREDHIEIHFSRIRLSKRAYEFIGSDNVLLLWDAETCRIAMRSSSRSDHRSYRIGKHRIISATGFLRHIGIYGSTKLVPTVHFNRDDKQLEFTVKPQSANAETLNPSLTDEKSTNAK